MEVTAWGALVGGLIRVSFRLVSCPSCPFTCLTMAGSAWPRIPRRWRPAARRAPPRLLRARCSFFAWHHHRLSCCWGRPCSGLSRLFFAIARPNSTILPRRLVALMGWHFLSAVIRIPFLNGGRSQGPGPATTQQMSCWGAYVVASPSPPAGPLGRRRGADRRHHDRPETRPPPGEGLGLDG